MKVDQEAEQKIDGELCLDERGASGLEQHMASTSLENAASTSNPSSMTRTEKSGYDQLPKEMNEVGIRDDKATNHDDKPTKHVEKVFFLPF